MSLQAAINRYAKLLERARADYDAATRALADCQQRLSALEQQVSELQAYADQLGADEKQPQAHQLLQRRQYLAQVFRAIEQQQQQLEAIRQEQARIQLRWKEARAQMKAMERLLEKQQQALADAEAKAVQRQLDEQAAWQYHTR